jgi:hypothetical protein
MFYYFPLSNPLVSTGRGCGFENVQDIFTRLPADFKPSPYQDNLSRK